jgi:MFS family permease
VPRKLPREVLALGWVSFFADVANEMIVALLPAFVGTLAGGGALALGVIEGFADALASLLKLVSGAWADRLGRYRPFVVAGYALAMLAKPFMALAHSAWHVALVRGVDRTGKGLRAGPRDALLAAAAPPDRRGAAFAFDRAMDHAGAVVGPLLAVGLLYFVTQDLRTIFWLSAIPGALVLVCLFGFVRERPAERRSAAPLPWRAGLPPGPLLRVLAPLALFTLGNSSDLFLLLLAGEKQASIYALPILWMALHVVKSATSFLGGRLVDRFGARPVIGAGWVWYALIYGGLALAQSQVAIVALVLVYGLYHGLTEGAEKALVAELAPAAQRGTWFGWFHLTIGLLAFPASLLFGWIWQNWSSAAAFGTGAALALAAALLLVALRPARISAP